MQKEFVKYPKENLHTFIKCLHGLKKCYNFVYGNGKNVIIIVLFIYHEINE